MESWSHTVPTMKAFAVARDDAPAIEMIDVDAPTPRRDEAVIAVHAFSVNRGETFLLEREPAGWRPGKDISGSVVAACADGSVRPSERGWSPTSMRVAGQSWSRWARIVWSSSRNAYRIPMRPHFRSQA
jgi:NADPH:quinone reductase-like Zn-dependent oxidoreductase